MRDRQLFGQRRGGLRAAIALVVVSLVAGCVTTAPVVTQAPQTFELPTFPSTTQRPVGPDDEVRIVEGSVTDTDGNPVPNAQISVSLDGAQLDELTTGNDGSFQIVGLFPPTLSLNVSADGYATAVRSVLVDGNQPQTFTPNIALAKLPAPIAIGAAGGVIDMPTGAAVAFQKSALPDGSNVVAYDAISAPPTDQLPSWDDGLIRTPLGWVEVTIDGAQPSKPAVVVLPLSEPYEPGSVLEVRSIDAQREWSDEIQYAVVGESGNSAITLADHFSGWAVFTKRSQKLGPPRKDRRAGARRGHDHRRRHRELPTDRTHLA